MQTRTAVSALVAIAALSACRDEPSVAEQFNALAAGVENRAQRIEAEAENMVTAEERRLDAEAEALQRQSENESGELNAAEDRSVNAR